MGPFGETVLAWRLERGMSQARLARAARVARPNLSAIERGDREVTLKTLRALAFALDVRPGHLVDGIMPGSIASPLGRAGFERVAKATAGGRAPGDPREATLTARLKLVAAARLTPHKQGSSRHNRPRKAERAHLLLKAGEHPSMLASLVDRLSGRRDR